MDFSPFLLNIPLWFRLSKTSCQLYIMQLQNVVVLYLQFEFSLCCLVLLSSLPMAMSAIYNVYIQGFEIPRFYIILIGILCVCSPKHIKVNQTHLQLMFVFDHFTHIKSRIYGRIKGLLRLSCKLRCKTTYLIKGRLRLSC